MKGRSGGRTLPSAPSRDDRLGRPHTPSQAPFTAQTDLSRVPGPTSCRPNILLDLLTEDPEWARWSAEALASARDAGPVVISPIVYAEVSVRFERIEDLDDALPATEMLREELPYAAGFLAAKAHLRYRRQGGTKRSYPHRGPGDSRALDTW